MQNVFHVVVFNTITVDMILSKTQIYFLISKINSFANICSFFLCIFPELEGKNLLNAELGNSTQQTDLNLLLVKKLRHTFSNVIFENY